MSRRARTRRRAGLAREAIWLAVPDYLLARVALAHAQLWPGMPHARCYFIDRVA